MAFLERVLGRSAAAPEPTASSADDGISRDDRIRGRTDIANFLDAFEAKDPDAMRRALDGASTHGERHACLEALVGLCDLPWVDGWVAGADPRDPLPFLVRGSTVVGPTVPELDDDAELERFRRADLDLRTAARRDPDGLLAWTRLITAGAALRIPGPEIVFRLDEALRRDPTNLAAHRAHIDALSSRGGGTDQEMWAFAMTVDEHVPVGSPLRAVVADAAVHRFGRSGETATISAETTIVTAAKRSVLHPDFAMHPCVVDRADAVAAFAEAFAVLGMPTELDRVVAVADRLPHQGRLRHVDARRSTSVQWERLRARLG